MSDAVQLTRDRDQLSLYKMNSSPTPTTEARSRVYQPNSSSDHISITSSITDESFDTDSIISNASFATSIASYKTETSVNSRNSRCNYLPRHKYAGLGHSRLSLGVGPVLSDVEDTSDLETESRTESDEAAKMIKTDERDVSDPASLTEQAHNASLTIGEAEQQRVRAIREAAYYS